MSDIDDRKIALFIPSLDAGGAERVFVNIANDLSKKGFNVDLILTRKTGSYVELVGDNVNIIDLRRPSVMLSVISLARYLVQKRPTSIMSGLNHSNVALILSTLISRYRGKVVISVHSTVSQNLFLNAGVKNKVMARFYRNLSKFNVFVVTVSLAVAKDLASNTDLSESSIITIYNPLNLSEILERSKSPVEHPWFYQKNSKIIIFAGRLEKVKDLPTLIRAFKIVRESIGARLVILGSGSQEDNIKDLISELGLESHVLLTGYVDNPYKYIVKSDVFVLSSIVEGFGNVIVEALSLNVPVVSTDCNGGPREIIECAGAGRLVEPSNPQSLAQAIIEVLQEESHPIPDLTKFDPEEILRIYENLLTKP